MTNLEQLIEKEYEKYIKEEKNNYNGEKPSSYGYEVRHLQVFIVFTVLCITFIARAHISATIVAMTDIPTPKNESFLEKQSLEFNFTEFNTTLDGENSNKELNSSTNLNLTNNFNNENITIDLDLNGIQIVSDDEETRKNISQAIVDNSLYGQEEADGLNKTTSSKWNVYRVYPWSKSTQEMILGSFFLGYLIMMSPIGLVCQRYGGKLPLQISLFSSAIITFLTPWIAVLGDYKAVSLSRVAIGLTQAGTFPSVHTLLAKWVPVSERGRLVTYVYSGAMIGSVLAYHVSGFLSTSKFGWPSVFWVTGILCLLMGILLTVIVTPSPQQNRYISEKEKNFILGGVKDQTEKKFTTPWKAIMTSKPVWACFIAHIGSATCFWFMFSQIPSYLHHAVGLNIKNSGLLSSLPYLANFFMSLVVGAGSDYLINKKIMSIKLVRIFSTSIASFGSAFGFFALSFITSPALAVSCLVFCMGTYSCTNTGWMLNYIDLGPNFSGTLMATGNTLMNISAVLLPVLVSNVVTDMSNVYQWRIVLFIVGILVLVCNTMYIIFMSTDVQPWNDAEYQTTGQEDPDDIEEKPDKK